MKSFRSSCLILLLWALATAASASEALVIQASDQPVRLGQHLYYTKAPQGSDEPPVDDQQLSFQRGQQDALNFGMQNSAYWFRLTLRYQPADPDAPRTKQWFLEWAHPYIDRLEFYRPAESEGYEKVVTGDRLPFSERPLAHRYFVFPITLTADETATYWFRVQTETSLEAPLTLWSPEAFYQATGWERFGFGVFYGTLMVMFFYNLFVYLSVRDRAYLYYIHYLFWTGLMLLNVNGFSFQWLWPQIPWLANVAIPVTSSVTMAAMMLFARHFLAIRSWSRRLHQGISGLMASNLALAVLSLWQPALGLRLGWLLWMLCVVVIFVAGVCSFRAGIRQARFFLVAWSAPLFGVVIMGLMVLGWLPSVFITEYGVQCGVGAEAVLLSFALASRIKDERQARLQAVEASLNAYAKRAAAEQRLVYQSTHHELTGLPNRTLFKERLEALTTQSSDGRWALVLMHLNQFREINYTLSRDEGDRLLKAFLDALNTWLSRGVGVLAIEEGNPPAHLAVIEGVSLGLIMNADQGLEQRLDELYERCQQPLSFHGLTLNLSVDMGVVVYPDHPGEAEGLIRCAQVAREAARLRQYRLVYYNADLDAYSERRLSLMGELRKAIHLDELALHYQPKIDLRSGKVVGVEALLRWQHRHLGFIPPDEFIPLAERTGVIKPLTRWVIAEAIACIKRLQERGLDIPVAVNISARNLLETDLAAAIVEQMNSNQLAAAQLSIEITESAVMEELHKSLAILVQLQKARNGVSVDDFGTGYSSLAQLKRLPARELKVDRSFVTHMGSQEDDRIIVEATINMGHHLGLAVVAEGIEDEATLSLLGTMGCDMVQGYHLARPMTEANLIEWLRQAPGIRV